MDEKFIDEALLQIRNELLKANSKHPPIFNSAHEGYAVLLEEVDEMWSEVKQDLNAAAVRECIQVGAMAVKFIVSIGSKNRAPKGN